LEKRFEAEERGEEFDAAAGAQPEQRVPGKPQENSMKNEHEPKKEGQPS
jgi:hypothetical protein